MEKDVKAWDTLGPRLAFSISQTRVVALLLPPVKRALPSPPLAPQAVVWWMGC